MVAHVIHVNIKRGIGVAEKAVWVRGVIAAVLKAQGITKPVEIDCLITDDAEIRELNRVYRKMDSATDVLSFQLRTGEDHAGQVTFPEEPDSESFMGSIVVSYPRARLQASQRKQSLESELTLLLVHGTLHLLGFDHEDRQQSVEMKAREMAIIGRLRARRTSKPRS